MGQDSPTYVSSVAVLVRWTHARVIEVGVQKNLYPILPVGFSVRA